MSPSHQARQLAGAVAWLNTGGIVAFPTDTFYGLAVDPRSDSAVEALFDLKGREARTAVPLLGGSRDQVERCCGALTGATGRLAERFWPGALSLIVDAPSAVASAAHSGSSTVAVRVAAHPIACALASAFGYLITATSANLSGEPPATTTRQLDGFGGDARLFILDGGPVPGGAPSTIVDARETPPRLVREGAIRWNRVLESLQE